MSSKARLQLGIGVNLLFCFVCAIPLAIWLYQNPPRIEISVLGAICFLSLTIWAILTHRREFPKKGEK